MSHALYNNAKHASYEYALEILVPKWLVPLYDRKQSYHQVTVMNICSSDHVSGIDTQNTLFTV